MVIVSIALTFATGILIILQFLLNKGGPAHLRRARWIGFLPLIPIVWNSSTAFENGTFFSWENVPYFIPGVFFYCFWIAAFRAGVIATNRATSTAKHERYARYFGISAVAAFLVPYLWSRFMM